MKHVVYRQYTQIDGDVSASYQARNGHRVL